MVGMPNRRSESGRQAFREVREWSGGPPEGSGLVRRPSERFESGLEAIAKVRVRLRGSSSGR